MKIAILGINHKLADLQLREKLSNACQKRFAAKNRIYSNFCCVLLSTCNRNEIYFSSDDLAEAHSDILNILREEIEEEFEHKLYSYFGADCFYHLCRVTVGLDSAIMGETEIQGQVKIAYEAASSYADLCKALHYLFQKALKIGKKIRSHFPTEKNLPDIEHAIYSAGTQIFPDVKKSRVLFIGASAINCRVFPFFKEKHISDMTLCNRSCGVAEELAERYGLQLLPWDQISCWHDFDWIILGTKAMSPLIHKNLVPEKILKHKLLIDLGVPRNVEPSVGDKTNVTLRNIDELNVSLSMRRARLLRFFREAEESISIATQQYMNLFREKEGFLLNVG